MFVGLGVFVGARVLVGIEVTVGILATVAVDVSVGAVVEIDAGISVGSGVSVGVGVDGDDGAAHPTKASTTVAIRRGFFPVINSYLLIKVSVFPSPPQTCTELVKESRRAVSRTALNWRRGGRPPLRP